MFFKNLKYEFLSSVSLSISPSYGARGEEILDGSLFRFHLSPFPQKRLILRLVVRHSRLAIVTIKCKKRSR